MRHYIHHTVDDLDGVSSAEERTFVLGRTKYSIDLSEEHNELLGSILDDLKPFLAAAKVGGKPPRKKLSVSMSSYGLTPADMEAFRQRHGIAKERGRYSEAQLLQAQREKKEGVA